MALLFPPLAACNHVPVDISKSSQRCGPIERAENTRLLFMASSRPMRRAGLTASARLTLPICLRFSLEGFGSLTIQSGTEKPDCMMTFATLRKRVLASDSDVQREHVRLDVRRIFVSEVGYRFPFSSSAAGTAYKALSM